MKKIKKLGANILLAIIITVAYPIVCMCAIGEAIERKESGTNV